MNLPNKIKWSKIFEQVTLFWHCQYQCGTTKWTFEEDFHQTGNSSKLYDLNSYSKWLKLSLGVIWLTNFNLAWGIFFIELCLGVIHFSSCLKPLNDDEIFLWPFQRQRPWLSSWDISILSSAFPDPSESLPLTV